MNQERFRPTFKGIRSKAIEFTVSHSDPILCYAIDKVIENTKVDYPDNFLSEYKQGIAEGYFPIIISSHQSHFDAMVISKITRNLTHVSNEVFTRHEQNKGFLMPIAMSVGSGHQDSLLKVLYDKAMPILNKNRILPVDLSRVKDNAAYNLPTNRRAFTKEMLIKLKEGYGGIILFPEGTVQSGRINAQGKPNGMQPFAEGSIATFTNFAQHTGKKAMYILVGIDGTRHIFNPDSKRPPLSKVVIGIASPSPKFASMNVGSIIKEDDAGIIGLTNEDKDRYLGQNIALLLPDYLRGIHA